MKSIEMIRIWLVFGVVLVIFNACVPANKLMYLQKDDELKHKSGIPKDTVVRVHTLNIQEYRIQPLDNISVQFETLNDENDEFDFLAKLAPQGRAGGSASGAGAGIGGIV